MKVFRFDTKSIKTELLLKIAVYPSICRQANWQEQKKYKKTQIMYIYCHYVKL